MKIFLETERLILREILPSDDKAIFEMDSDPEVHQYLGKTISQIEESQAVITAVRQQYVDFGIGRWAMIEKSTGDFMGWTGLKFVTLMRNDHINYYDLGYRMMPRYWGKGYATESALPCVDYGFSELKLDTIYGMADMNNIASRKVLEKSGLHFAGTFEDGGFATGWYELSKQDWLTKQMK